MAGKANLPVILMVPEVNMADWENRQPVTWLAGQNAACWYERYFDALHHLQKGDWQAAAHKALEMLKLDQYASSTACHLLARAKIGQGSEEEARKACEAAIDNTYYPAIGFMSAPQAGSMVKAIIRKAAGQYGFGCIDLPAIFTRYTGQRLQGRRLFLDYCHLTIEGMQVAMAALACEILKFSGVNLSWEQALTRLPQPKVSAELDATAKFGAAVHTAHRLLATADKKPILQYWCEEALKASPQIEETMLDFIAARHPFCPVVLSSAQQRNLKSAYPMGYQHGWCHSHLDPDLIEVIAAVLEKAGRFSMSQVTDRLMDTFIDLMPESIDLISTSFFLWEPLERFYPECMTHFGYTAAAFFRAPWPQSRFALIGDGERGMKLDVVMRLPHICGRDKPPVGQVSLELNGKKLIRLSVSNQWQRTDYTIPPGLLKRGLNPLVFNWPMPHMDGDRALKMAADLLKTGQSADIHPTFGEIFKLQVAWQA
ncbi:MAG: hypothetical protein GY850_30025 [bacterium]|nr:hypothetical protein [bacterium]